MKANKPMTSEQLNELMTVAVNMQRDAETDCKRPSAMFAYAVQVAVLELCKVRNDAAALAAENAGLKAACERVSMWNDFPQVTLRSTGEVVPYAVAYGSNGERDYMRNIAATAVLKDTTATDAFLAEVRAAAVDEVCLKISNAIVNCYQDEMVGLDEAATICGDFAAQLRKGVQS
ncbi:hypothetical protein L423_03208 [Enterobacter roggenkampii]|uniref:hypothetical protein n=1 Tax=Enterobacter roggenkampii TaxID=1812935 RepID=UPI0003BFC965|nr:hypothetical protein [Enterobacter roggenkampii]ESL75531.1 hypothetical protein L423_03208 [Enterobacter roggenkampii]